MRNNFLNKLPPYWFDTSVKALLGLVMIGLIISYSMALTPKIMYQTTELPTAPVHELDKLTEKERIMSTRISAKTINEKFQKSLIDLPSVRMLHTQIKEVKASKLKLFSPVSDSAKATQIQLRMQISYPELLKFIKFWQLSNHTILWQKVDYYESRSNRQMHEADLSFIIV